jgi:hypothetical protein
LLAALVPTTAVTLIDENVEDIDLSASAGRHRLSDWHEHQGGGCADSERVSLEAS